MEPSESTSRNAAAIASTLVAQTDVSMWKFSAKEAL